MKMSSVLSSHLKADEIGPNKRIPVTISHVQMGKVGDDDKPILYFEGKDKGLPLNKTNINALVELLGDESDLWGGRRVLLYTTKVDYQGKKVLGIRFDALPAPAAAPAAAPVARPAVSREPGEDDGDPGW
jgi:hypothetical protein